MTEFLNTLQTSGQYICVLVAVLLCAGGILLSCLSLSGTWLVLIAAALLYYVLESSFPGIWTIVTFFVLSVGVEILEFFAGWVGISKRGGSKLAGFMAVIGGFMGMAIGSALIPVIGTILGMFAGSFGLAFLVERDRLKKDNEAANIALGAVFSRVAVIMLKVCVTLGMIIVLIIGMILTRVS